MWYFIPLNTELHMYSDEQENWSHIDLPVPTSPGNKNNNILFLSRVYCILNTMLCVSESLFHLSNATTLWFEYHYPHLTMENLSIRAVQ